MTKQEAKGYCDLIMALAEGKTVLRETMDAWIPAKSINTDFPLKVYRIKPQPKLVPFDFSDAEKLIGCQVTKGLTAKITGVLITYEMLYFRLLYDYDRSVEFVNAQNMLKEFNFLDGSPCGKEVVE